MAELIVVAGQGEREYLRERLKPSMDVLSPGGKISAGGYDRITVMDWPEYSGDREAAETMTAAATRWYREALLPSLKPGGELVWWCPQPASVLPS